MNTRVYSFLAVLGLVLLLAGCVQVEYTAEQSFRDDGTSNLKIYEKVTLPKNIYSDYYDSYYDSYESYYDPSSIARAVVVDYYKSRNYAEDICKSIKSKYTNDVKCTPHNDGSVELDAELEPGMLYSFEKRFDLLNFENIYTYGIVKVPTVGYFVDSDMLSQNLKNGLKQYFMKNADNYVTNSSCRDIYYVFDYCSFSEDDSGETITISSYEPENLTWYSCEEKDFSKYWSVDEEDVTNIRYINKSLDAYEEYTITCPKGTKSLVLGYTTLEYDYESDDYLPSNTTSIIKLITRDDIKQEVLDSLDEDSDYYGSSYYSSYLGGGSSSLTSTFTSLDYLNFRRGEFGNIKFSDLAGYSGGSLFGSYDEYSPRVEIEYVAKFDGRIESVKIAGERIYHDQHSFYFTQDDLADLPRGKVEVVVKKQLIPFGIFVWIFGGFALFALVIFWITSSRRVQ